MNRVILSDRDIRDDLFPFTLTRSVADIRMGATTIREKWQRLTGKEVLLIDEVSDIGPGETVVSAGILPSAKLLSASSNDLKPPNDRSWSEVQVVKYPWDIFLLNDWAIRDDFKQITAGRYSEPLPESVFVSNARHVFVEQGAKLTHCYINAETGPVYIGKNAEVMEGALLRGPLAVCEGAVIKMGAKIYGATTIGPYSIVGGEIKNSVIFGYSNKAHDGYLGDSVIGEWCNLGAGTSNSNMKNNVSDVRMWNTAQRKMISTGTTKCGLVMGDYSRAAINTTFNTGTMVGICANVFGNGQVPKFVPNFCWGSDGHERYDLEKAFNDIEKWKKLKGGVLDEKEKTRLKLIFEQ